MFDISEVTNLDFAQSNVTVRQRT